jgi:hypothetical protein
LWWNYPGTHSDSEGMARILGFVTTVAGMLVFALMIGVVSDSIGARVDDLKKGTSKVCCQKITRQLTLTDALVRSVGG